MDGQGSTQSTPKPNANGQKRRRQKAALTVVCALGFSLAFLAEIALTSAAQDILATQLQKEERRFVFGAPVEGVGVTCSRGVALLGGPGLRLEPLHVPCCWQGSSGLHRVCC